MMYLSRGVPAKPPKGSSLGVSYCGRVYALGPELSALWKAGRASPIPVPAGCMRTLCRLEESGLVVTTEEDGPLALTVYRLLTACVICPNKKERKTDRFLTQPVRRIWTWITEAGLHLTASELVRLEERQLKPIPALLGEEGRQRLTEMIYMAETIPDGILETLMEHSPARDTTMSALLKLLRTGRIFLI